MKVMAKNNPIFNPDEIIKKQARGSDGSDLGEIKDIYHDYGDHRRRYYRQR